MTGQTRVAIRSILGPMEATVEVPGSKSVTNRALVCATLATGPSQILNFAPGDDTAAMLAGLNAMGARCIIDGDDVEIQQPVDRISIDEVVVDANLAGTTARFLTAVGAVRAGTTTITGNSALRHRPMAGLFDALSALGAQITTLETHGHLPVRIRAGDQRVQQLSMSGDVSSQFISALLLIAPLLTNGLQISITGSIISEPYLAMTCSVMKDFGARIDHCSSEVIAVGTQGYTGRSFVVEPDASSASYPLAAAAIVGGSVKVPGFGINSVQGDVGFIKILEKMGCTVQQGTAGLTVSRNLDAPLLGIEANMSSMSDLVPTLAVVAMFASTPTHINGVAFIREKESDRLGDLATELRAVGGTVEVTPDGLIINPSQVHGGVVETHHDHRIAMALSLVGLVCHDVIINDAHVVSKSWPGYWAMLDSL